MRGKAIHKREAVRVPGITPAYAGKRQFSAFPLKFVWDHPRLCGEKLIAISIFLCASGSPPPMRGKDEFDMDEVDDARITPAYAGKRVLAAGHTPVVRDHPRLCGEKNVEPKRTDQKFRITPAYAGKRCGVLSKKAMTKDHPRLCGEKVRQSRTCGSGQGSPPPMRGKDRTFLPLCRKVGITPAYAGKSDRDFVAVHKFIGSPPPMRGKET